MAGSIITVANHNVGVGKTATSINLSHALAKEGKKVLVIDMDPQCNSTSLLFGTDRPKYSLTELLNPDNGILENAADYVYETDYENLHILPNTKSTIDIEHILIKREKRDSLFMLKDRFKDYAKQNFDIVIIDCPPYQGLLVLNALAASDGAIVPYSEGCQYGIEGLIEAVTFIEEIQKSLNLEIQFLKVLLTKQDKRKLVHKPTIKMIGATYPKDKVFETAIPSNAFVQQADAKGITIFKMRSNLKAVRPYKALGEAAIAYKIVGTVVIAYRALAKELISIIEE